ncbi:MAG: peptide chain release factor N(5)-glutamine methyltransferase [Candidatus Eremiobacteraeota bacterium]|nr:peptide chain release factor N(5)-glutamine methyltransferase [Candidatus Eremiobacteraeota bacterium]
MMQAGYKPDTVQGILARAILQLARVSESPRLDAQILLAHSLGRDKAWLLTQAQTFVSKPQTEKFWALVEKRSAGMPVAYVIGTWGFYGREFDVTADVLVPRPETEHLVDTALTYLNSRVRKDSMAKQLFSVLDVGVGSGAIACSIAAEFAYSVVEGTDISEKALKVAQRNARRFNVQGRCKFHLGDLAAPVAGKKYDCILANLPYVPTAELPCAPNPVSYEPVSALDGGADGLEQYRRLLPQLPALVKPDALLLLEAAPRTIDALHDLAVLHFPGALVEVARDYADLDRFVTIRLTAQR